MNFYSHAVVASWVSPEPSFVLGSMLPDLCRMAGEKPLKVGGLVGHGIDCHEHADAIFHGHQDFRQLCSAGFERLQELGLSRGSARASAHIGVELLIDGWLYDDEYGREHYLASVARGADVLADHGPSPALLSVVRSLHGRGVERAHTSADAVARRIDYATRGRKRLALARRDLSQLRKWADETRTVVEAASPRMIRDVASSLGASVPKASRLEWADARG